MAMALKLLCRTTLVMPAAIWPCMVKEAFTVVASTLPTEALSTWYEQARCESAVLCMRLDD